MPPPAKKPACCASTTLTKPAAACVWANDRTPCRWIPPPGRPCYAVSITAPPSTPPTRMSFSKVVSEARSYPTCWAARDRVLTGPPSQVARITRISSRSGCRQVRRAVRRLRTRSIITIRDRVRAVRRLAFPPLATFRAEARLPVNRDRPAFSSVGTALAWCPTDRLVVLLGLRSVGSGQQSQSV